MTFVLFLSSASWFLINFLLLNLDRLSSNTTQGKLSAIIMLIYSISVGIFVIALLIVQLIMIANGLTTLEYLRKQWKGSTNPYNQGCCKNYSAFICENRCHQSITIEHLNSRCEIELGDNALTSISTNTSTTDISEQNTSRSMSEKLV
jgi:hypothetical protein